MERILNKTYDQLWNDPDFITKRVGQQHFYLFMLGNKVARGAISQERYNELRESAMHVLETFEQQKINLLYGNTARED